MALAEPKRNAMSEEGRILVAADVTGDAELVRQLLADEFTHVFKSVDPEHAVQDFETYRPNVLVLAFDSLAKAEVYYLGLYRLGTVVHALVHRTIILCQREELQKVYALCRKQYFDDYVLFWPVGHDAPRLPMAVHHALRLLAMSEAAGPTAAAFAHQARKLADLESQLDQYAARGAERIDRASETLQNESRTGMAIDGLASRLNKGDLRGIIEVKDGKGLQREIDQLKAMELLSMRKTIASAVEPVRGWASGLKDALSPGMASVRQLQAMAERVRAVVMLVDDDDFQHKLLRRLLNDAACDLVSAMNGTEAMAAMRHRLPDLILMDVQLPDVDGIELTRRIRANARFAEIPVVMVTGQSDKNVVVQSIKVGASGFLVKPFNKENLLNKIRNTLDNTKHAGAD
jgi:CheY-like chemotaxis protein